MATSVESRLTETRLAFDAVAVDYDGPVGNNALIQRMRERLWREVERRVPQGGRLLDLGCGTGLDAAHFAASGYRVVAVDGSAEMVHRTAERAAAAGLAERVSARQISIQELARLADARFDGIVSDLGPLNCVDDLEAAASACGGLLPPGGVLVASVIGRICPWEIVHYLLHGHPRRALLRFRGGPIPVRLREGTVWTRYITPRRFARAFTPGFSVLALRGMGLFLPPPYLLAAWERRPHLLARLGALDDRLAGLPLLRQAGDHFLATLVHHG